MLRARPAVILSRAVFFQQELTVRVGDGEHGVVVRSAGVDVRVGYMQRAGKTRERLEWVFESFSFSRGRGGVDGGRRR